jgi:hypothetical protein
MMRVILLALQYRERGDRRVESHRAHFQEAKMNEHHHHESDHSRDIIVSLFHQPPVSSIDLRKRLENIDRFHARQLVVDRLADKTVSDRDGPIILAVLDVLGVGDERRRLTNIALDQEREPRIRMWAAMSLAAEDPRMMDLLITELGPEGMAHLAENAVIELMTVQNPEKLGKTIRRALEEWHQELSAEKLLSRIEVCRQGLGISCADAYEETLRSPRIGNLRRKILDFFVDEGSDEGILFLEHLRTTAKKPTEKRALQATLLRLRSAQIDPHATDRQQTNGRALVSNCDGQGGFIVLGIFDNADSTQSISELYIHTDGEIRDGVVHPRLTRDNARKVVEELQQHTHCYFAEVPPEKGATLVFFGLERTGLMADIERREVRQAIRLFRRCLTQGGFETAPTRLPTEKLDLEKIRNLLSRPEYEETWMFDLNDLSNLGIKVEEVFEPDEEWITECAAQIGGTELARRVLAMAEHMAKWHSWKGETDESALLIAMADDVAARNEKSLLLHVMLERSADWIHAD